MQPPTSHPQFSVGRPVALEVDHLHYLSDRPYRRQVIAAYRRAARKRAQLMQQNVLHERDGSCCRREDWPATARRIQAALAADGPRVGWMFTSDAGAALLLPPSDEGEAS